MFGSKIRKDRTRRHHIHGAVMHAWLRNDLASSTGQIGLDIGAGELGNRPFFKTEVYIAIEPKAKAIATARKRFPDATIYQSTIEEYQPEQPVDLGLACSVLSNNDFPVLRTMENLRLMVSWIAPGGNLFFNIGPKVVSFEKEIDDLLNSAFASVEKKPYGRFRSRLPTFITVPFGNLFARFPAINEPSSIKKRSVYYACRNKRPNI